MVSKGPASFGFLRPVTASPAWKPSWLKTGITQRELQGSVLSSTLNPLPKRPPTRVGEALWNLCSALLHSYPSVEKKENASLNTKQRWWLQADTPQLPLEITPLLALVFTGRESTF